MKTKKMKTQTPVSKTGGSKRNALRDLPGVKGAKAATVKGGAATCSCAVKKNGVPVLSPDCPVHRARYSPGW